MNRAYSLLNIKSVDDEKRIMMGVATTPTPDRVSDVVEPMGAQFKNPMPLLWQHDSQRPIGTVRFSKPTKDGIEFEARMPRATESSILKDRIDEAWESVKLKLVSAVSIGFRSLEHAMMDNGGVRFLKTEILELSLVTIPANADATIHTVKSLDTAVRAASGQTDDDADQTKPGVTGLSKVVVSKAVEAKKMTTVKKTVLEQISAFEATRAAKAARMEEIMTKAADEGTTLDETESQEYDGLEGEIKQVDEHLVRLRNLEDSNKRAAVTVNGSTAELGSESRGRVTQISVKRNVPPGIIFTRVLGAKYLAFKHGLSPIEVAKSKFSDTPEVELILRAPIAAMDTVNATSASPLVELDNATGEFVELLRPKTIIGRIPGLNRVPFNIKVPRGTSDPTAYWVGEGKVKPVSSMAFDQIELTFAKVAGIVTQTEELMRFSKPASEGLIRDGLVNAVSYLIDRDFLDPTKAVTDVSPASVTNGVTPRTASGTDADAFRADLGWILDEYEDDNMGADNLVLIMTSKQAGRLSLMRNTLGQNEFASISRQGGSIEGIPVITSNNIVATGGSPVDGSLIVALNASSIMLADDGGVEIDISREASLQMESAPDSPATASTVLVSLWQHNMVAIRAERFINWKKSRDGAVQFIQNAKYA